jgi:periplasmic copper chaperone A
VFVPNILSAFVVSLLMAGAAAVVPSVASAQASTASKPAAKAPSGTLIVQNAWVRKPPGVDTAAVYFVLVNSGAKPVTVVGVSSSLAEHVMIHETSTVDGQSRMRMKDSVVVGAGKSVAFAPEGLHVMLSGFRYDVAVGDRVPLTLQLEGGGKVSVDALVRPLGAQ